jgi:tRNA threonylcarbamoyladenosine biosynthesis protein TsaB
MKLLALDTATEACSAALWIDGRVAERFDNAGRSHTEQMMPMVQGLMAEASLPFAALDGLVCGIGPGSFAGVRIGVSYVKGLALALDRPVVGISSLPTLALPALDAGATRVLVAIDARMNEIYWGAYARGDDGLPIPLQAEGVCPPSDLPSLATLGGAGEWVAVGSGWAAYGELLRPAAAQPLLQIDGSALPHAADALRLAIPQFEQGRATSADELTPAYLRNKVALNLIEQAALRAGR